jgi:hypothetical protein
LAILTILLLLSNFLSFLCFEYVFKFPIVYSCCCCCCCILYDQAEDGILHLDLSSFLHSLNICSTSI